METEKPLNVSEIEEGEIENDDDDDDVELYTPLERPHVPMCNSARSSPISYNEDNASNESSSDSDSSIKKLNLSKIRRKIVPAQSASCNPPLPKRKNYNIWCTDLQTEVLTNNLVECNVDQNNDRTRDIESYNYKTKAFFDCDESKSDDLEMQKSLKGSDINRKRNHYGSYINKKQKGNSFQNEGKVKESKGPPRKILALTTTINDSIEDIAKDIANKLLEEKEDLVLRALNIVGKEPIISLFEETRKIEKKGGMLIMNGCRRRTPGGVFFFLLKTSTTIPQDQIHLVFAEDRKATAQEKKKAHRELQKLKSAKLKEALSKDDFPTLLSRTELAIKEFKAKKMAEESAEVKNPPPSPATDGRENSSDGEEQKFANEDSGVEVFEGRTLTAYDDSFLDVGEDVMDTI